MARYVDDFRAEEFDPRGMDPNYARGYRGMRTRGFPGQARYGAYREEHLRELSGGGAGWSGGRGYDRGLRGYDREFGRGYDRGVEGGIRQGGGAQFPGYDREYLRNYSADLERYRRGGPARGYDENMRGLGEPHRGHYEGYDPRYGNRGLSSSGYGQPWLGVSDHPRR